MAAQERGEQDFEDDEFDDDDDEDEYDSPRRWSNLWLKQKTTSKSLQYL